MKKIVILFVLTAMLSSCVTHQKYREYSAFIDYSQYMKEGFFLTESNSVNFDYIPVGNVSSLIVGGKSGKKTIYVSHDDALWLLYSKAKEMKANGIINLKFTYISGNSYSDGYTSHVGYSSISVSGMAIRRSAAKTR
ncbi:uncharacterized protein YbjQ (UPF0145 family) [Parabacteroides sp. PF5-5]|uniref:lipoprotein n=1 Tax=unclassified Parabacteroides TaxID=2649774 RepID=UPI0024753BE3|nr:MULTISPECIES: lipoprotein [unclassified Parabacteroides]MDH6304658.1 uncharacterized protein YbjQ (UPF0145 family) [Parabacteroides sp. PH5-39]MDH6315728.1 uncharacterized protein YbjQ (UPF0145 family) [Parabacteroides sp. PF5-13]MDH6319388.1 uncharacterized protein YbjQ (UPF0145 family) [Parabacteroides sp. PH5-13]MDH6323119.1 uncharacterized protein YbjQ (UPF0145 family) [Parabacteroides sp. PH5-8]MDH6326921.1 uncharacterized protein YbjQ (UPF0145 family) [Parabacteroides sp. PH5-41]